ncbi:antibiotic biosynthesis monooxygenase [Alicyclobacillus sp. SO9]|uniref:antibiotic biosynthesis monooxygenase family protein n=1 Tax=Alicyclobacillus sp. SO9 TaxID=2665646 RepID=UPI0018E908C4|nr:antibiotic biosynthesis monooxygenase [Alicyclobacillus sp. SO9]QQE79899.1 antibiotic biosynthesis monooxygenase [Alicyclobacillus sp. SO9]
MFIAANRIEVSEEEQQKMQQGFAHNAPNLKEFDGFLGFELWTEEDGALLAVSRWESKEAFEGYIHSDMFKQHHGGESGQKMQPRAKVTYYTGKVIS